MKKCLGILLALALACGIALADELPIGAFVRIEGGQGIDIDGDGNQEVVFFEHREEDDGASFTLRVGDLEIADHWADYLTGELYALRLAGVAGALLFVPDYGMSSDYASYVFHYLSDYQGVQLYEIGYVGGFPQSMEVTGINTFATYERGRMLLTWFRPADYVVATGYYYDDDGVTTTYGLAEVPRDIYPVGALITLKADLPLMASRTDETIVRTLRAGDVAAVSGSDDVEWLYIAAPTEDYGEAAGGWVRMERDSFDEIRIGGESVHASDVMDGLLYAD